MFIDNLYIFIIYFNYSINLIIFTFLISLVSQSGDLFVSYLKRKANSKDTGKFLPGHGGLLDRLDGIIFAVPLGIKTFIFLNSMRKKFHSKLNWFNRQIITKYN